MRCACCRPVSPITRFRKQPSDGPAGGEGDLDVVDEVVRDEDAGVENFIVGKKPKEETTGVQALKSPREMSPREWAEHLVTHLPYCDSCPFCIAGRCPNRHHRRHGFSRDVPSLVADYGFLKAYDDDLCPFLGVLVRPWKICFATMIDHKGPDPLVVKRLARFMRDCGLQHSLIRVTAKPQSDPCLPMLPRWLGLSTGRRMLKRLMTTLMSPIRQRPHLLQSLLLLCLRPQAQEKARATGPRRDASKCLKTYCVLTNLHVRIVSKPGHHAITR